MRNECVFMKEIKGKEPIYVSRRINHVLQKEGFVFLDPNSKKDQTSKFVLHSYSRGYYPTDEELAELANPPKLD